MSDTSNKQSLRVVALEAENFMRLRAVKVVPRGAVVEVVGRNGQGKTSVLEAIWATLGGASAAPEAPVRLGSQKGETYLDLGELRVTRTYDANGGTTSLKVEGKDGSRVRTPQAALDRLVSLVAFDPLRFVEDTPAKQAETLRQLAGLTLDDLDDERGRLAEARTDLNRSVTSQQQEHASYGPESEYENIPDEPVSIDALAEELREAHRLKAVNDERRSGLRAALADRERDRESHRRALIEVEKCERRLKEAQSAAEHARKAAEHSAKEVEAETPQVEALQDPDVAAVMERIGRAEKTNTKVRTKANRKALKETLDANVRRLQHVNDKLAHNKAERSRRIAAAKLPLPGLSLTEDGSAVLLDGVPVKQASSARSIILGLTVAAALSPRLRVARIQDGSLLDDDSMDAVRAWAEANDWQIWVEKVGGPNSPSGVIIEDGEVHADRQPGPPPKQAPSRFGAAALALLDEQEQQRDPERPVENDPLEGPLFTDRK